MIKNRATEQGNTVTYRVGQNERDGNDEDCWFVCHSRNKKLRLLENIFSECNSIILTS